MPRTSRPPLDPDTPEGAAAAEALTDVVAALTIAVEDRKRQAQTAATERDSEAA